MINSIGFHILENFLLSDAVPQDSMTIWELDGFLNGLAAGPEVIPFKEWSSIVWGSGTPTYRSAKQKNLILDLLARRYSEVANLLEASSEDTTPNEAEDRDDDIVRACAWSTGFLQAMELRTEAWRPLLDDPNSAIYLLPLANLYRESAEDYVLPFSPDLNRAMVLVAATLLPTCARRIRHFWKDRVQDNFSTRIAEQVHAVSPEAGKPPTDIMRFRDKLILIFQEEASVGAVATRFIGRAVLPTRRNAREGRDEPGLPEAMLITDMSGRILSVNEAFTTITGYASDDVIGQTPRILRSSLASPAEHAGFWSALLNKGHWHGLVWNRTRSGEPIQIRQTVTLLKDANDQPVGYISVFKKIDRCHVTVIHDRQSEAPLS